nr:unnamed protein product [Spirometra erinaceieuropaei]
MPTNQPDQLGTAGTRPTGLEEDSEDRRCDLRSESHRRRQSEMRSPQIPTSPNNPRSNRPERRTALVPRELARYKVDVAALSETRFSEQGQLEEQRLREMQDAWTARKAEEIQGYADHNEWKNFFSAIKAVYGPPTKDTAPPLSADSSTLLTDKTQILQRWAGHFRGVLNRPSAISDAAIARLPQVETNADLDLTPSLQETIRAVQQLYSGKAPGSDAIPAEVYKHGCPLLMDHLTALFQEMWRQGDVPQDFKDATIEKRQEMRTHLYSTLVDLMKVFDTVKRERLWKIMQKFGCPERFTQMVRQLHDGMMARVTNNGAVSEAFAVTNGVKQRCVLAPTLFSLMFSVMLMDAYRDERPGIRIAYRTEGHLLNQRLMKFQSRVSTTTVHKLLFADDCALNTTSE